MTAGQLLRWDAIDRRRRGARPWLVTAVIAALAAGALVAIGRAAGTAEAGGWWLLGCVIGAALVPMGAPWRFYWRGDSTLLARLPIPGDALYRLGAVRGVVAAAQVLVVLLVAAAPALAVDPAWFARAALLAGASVLAGALVAPPAAVAAGVLVASEKAPRAFDNMTGAGGAPSVVWLSVVPAAVGTAVGTLPLMVAWGRLPLVALAAAAAGALVLYLAAAPLARRALPEATREVAALDRVRLAHVELDRARGLERVVAAAAGPARPVFEKDVALARRRYPSYYLWVGAAVIGMWICAFAVDEPTRTRWIVGLGLGVIAYGALLGSRLRRPPVELPRLLDTLPFPPGSPARAKLVYVTWRTVAPLVLGVAPYLWRQ